MKTQVLDEKEATAAGYYFGVSNLGLRPDKPAVLIEKFGKDWDAMARHWRSKIDISAESDDSYDGMMREVNHWIGIMTKGDEYFLKEWAKLKKEVIG